MTSESVSRSPFFHRGPIRDPGFFYGRSAETQAVLSLLAQMQNCSVAGPIKIGKTSFLHHLTRPEVWREHGLDPAGHALTYVTFEDLGAQPPGAIFHTLAQEATRAAMAEPFADGPPRVRGDFDLSELRRSLEALTRGGGRVIWLIDEFELAAENPNLDLHFFSALRSLVSEPELAMVTATHDPLHEMALGERRVGSPLADLFTLVRLGALGEEEARTMVRDLSSRAGRNLEPYYPHLCALAGEHAFLLQVLCDLVMRRDREPGEQDWEDIAAPFYDQVEPFLNLQWLRLRRHEREALVRVVQNCTRPEDDVVLRHLERMALVTIHDDCWVPACRVIGDFLIRRATPIEPTEVLSTADALREPPTEYRVGDDAMRRVVRALARAVEAHHHSGEPDRTAWYAMMIARQMGCDEATVEQVRIAGRLRDIGHVATPELVFHKPAPLAAEEWAIVRAHPAVGAQILEGLELPPQVKPAVRWHHERLDGSGYPDGLIGEEIPLPACIVGVAEAYAAMTAERPHRPAMSPTDALETLKADADAYPDGVVMALEKVVARETGVT